MISDQQIAAELKIPEGVVGAIRAKRWSVLRGFAQKKWNEDGFAAQKRWSGAVDRILTKYTDLFGHDPFKSTSHAWTIQEGRKSIAIWIDRIGNPASLIKDMEAAKLNGDKPRTINWFIFRADGQACRWEMLWLDLMNQRAEEAKRKELDWTPDEDTPDAVRNFLKSGHKAVTPTWVAEAKERLRVLSKFIQDGDANPAMRREWREIQDKLKDHGHLDDVSM